MTASRCRIRCGPRNPLGVLSFLRTSPSCIFVSYFAGLYICDYFSYNFGDLYHRTCFTQPTQILHVLLTYIAMSNKALFECSNIRILEYSNNLRYSNNTIRIQILFLYSNIRIFEYSTTALTTTTAVTAVYIKIIRDSIFAFNNY